MKNLGKEELHIKIIFVAMVLILAVVLIPLFMIGHYNFQSVDDVGYATTALNVWKETHSVFKVFAGQFSCAWDSWRTWQGTFAAGWFAASTMGLFIENAYYMGTYLALGGFVISELLLFAVIFRRILGADMYRAGIISICIICMQVLLTTVPVEAFYWFCGALTYTVVYNEAIVLFTLLIILYFYPKKLWKRILLYVGITLLTIMVSGGTYVTLIAMLLIYFFILVWYWHQKNSHRWFIAAEMGLYIAGFLLNVLAPGNHRRLALANVAETSVIKAILLSIKEAAYYVTSNTIFPCMILALLFLPLFVDAVRKKKYRYPFPVLVTFITFGIFAAQFMPTIYTLGITGAGRIQNLYRWTFYIWLYGNELYWTGWLLRRLDWLKNEKGKESSSHRTYILPGWIAGGLIFCFSLYVWGGDTLTTLSAVNSLRHGEAQTYFEEYQERLAVLKDDSVKDVRFRPYTYYPYLLYFGDITDNPEDWVNYTVATCYGKDSVVLIEE